MNVSDEEIAARLKKWKAPRLKVNRGTLAKYVHLVGDASHGVCFYPASFFLYLFIFYFTSFRPYIISTMRTIFLFLSQPYIPCCNEGLDVSKDVKRTNHCSSPSFDIVSMICSNLSYQVLGLTKIYRAVVDTIRPSWICSRAGCVCMQKQAGAAAKFVWMSRSVSTWTTNAMRACIDRRPHCFRLLRFLFPFFPFRPIPFR